MTAECCSASLARGRPEMFSRGAGRWTRIFLVDRRDRSMRRQHCRGGAGGFSGRVGGRSRLVPSSLARSSFGRFDAIAEGELDDVVADITRPAGNELHETSSVVREQRARGFLEARKVA